MGVWAGSWREQLFPWVSALLQFSLFWENGFSKLVFFCTPAPFNEQNGKCFWPKRCFFHLETKQKSVQVQTLSLAYNVSSQQLQLELCLGPWESAWMNSELKFTQPCVLSPKFLFGRCRGKHKIRASAELMLPLLPSQPLAAFIGACFSAAEVCPLSLRAW